MRFFIGDVGGEKALLHALLERAVMAEGATEFIFLGDLIDRGSDSRGVVTLIREWFERFPCTILWGNHEMMCHDWVNAMLNRTSTIPYTNHAYTTHYEHNTWLYNGGFDTLESYGIHNALEAFDMTAAHPLVKDIDWIKSVMQPCYVKNGIVATHAPIPYSGTTPTVDAIAKTDIFWNRSPPYPMKDSFQIFGHNAHWMVSCFQMKETFIERIQYDMHGSYEWEPIEPNFAICIDGSRKGIAGLLVDGTRMKLMRVYRDAG